MNYDLNPKNADPYKSGFADALFNRPCESPWRNDGFKHIRKNSEYLKGYLDGESNR